MTRHYGPWAKGKRTGIMMRVVRIDKPEPKPAWAKTKRYYVAASPSKKEKKQVDDYFKGKKKEGKKKGQAFLGFQLKRRKILA